MTIFSQCAAYRDDLAAFIDGELTGAERLRMSGHLEQCPACAVEAERVQNIGTLLRTAAREATRLPAMNGLASGVVARVRAEAAYSWRAVIGRGFDDWHWFIVGGGTVAATFVSMLLATAMLVFGSRPVQQDSLAGLMTSLETQSGTLLVEVGGANSGPAMEVDSGASKVIVMPTGLGFSEPELVSLVMNLIVSKGGRIVSLAEMPAVERRNAEALLQSIADYREGRAGPNARGRLDVLRIRLLATTEVSVPGL